MNLNGETIINYVKSEGVNLNLDDFLFQIKKHTDYPSLLAISDTLNIFNIKNGALNVEFKDIESLPERFLALLNNENEAEPNLFFIRKKGGMFFLDKKGRAIEISKSDLKLNWTNIVFLVEKSTSKNIILVKKSNWTLLSFIFILLCLTFWNYKHISKIYVFFTLSLFGLLFSIFALKELFGLKNELLDSFCNIGKSINCDKIMHSSNSKVLKFINFSDLSIVFFLLQISSLFLLIEDITSFLSIQKVLVYSSIPFLVISVYYQKRIQKTWCPICLSIILVVLLEIYYLTSLQNFIFNVSNLSLAVFGFNSLTVLSIWIAIKKLLLQNKNLKEFEIKGYRFMRNYEIFKNTLFASPKIDYKNISSENIILGEINTSLNIVIVLNPFCKHCSEIPSLIHEILSTHKNKVQFNLIFNTIGESADNKATNILQKLLYIYLEKDLNTFIKAFSDWFKHKNDDLIDIVDIPPLISLKINKILENNNNWIKNNKIKFSPEIIINHYIYPKQYERKELIYFISDLIEENNF